MLSPNTQAILLLTGHFSKAGNEDVRPLTNREWGQFALWLKEQGLTPEKLLDSNPEALLAHWPDSKITTGRLLQLLNRGSALALAVEKWLRSGLWIITRSDGDYPQRLKMHLKTDSPPVLFGCGNRSLLNRGGIAVVGSRKANDDDLAYSRQLGQLVAAQGYSIVSGGARGIDEFAMLGSLEAEGTVIGVMADSLLRAASSSKYRRHLVNNNLVLISPFYPEAGFNPGNAMQRNKYIYCLADVAVAVHSGTSGGTWNGVVENLKKGWVPMWVKPSDDATAGNSLLVKQGARYLSEPLDQLDLNVFITSTSTPVAEPKGDLFGQSATNISEPQVSPFTPEPGREQKDTEQEQPPAWTETSELEPKPTSDEPQSVPEPELGSTAESEPQLTPVVRPEEKTNPNLSDLGFYDLFLAKLASWCTSKALSVEQLQELSGLHKSQLTGWLKQAVDEGHITKLSRPVRYRCQTAQQNDMFKDK
ncbi:DNA-processing protein DprA [Porticoccus hydrocarbonoclasticus]|uniref:DNA-processing protein DprA n=1 Tax=Porticoccus hydrocarbonoclasticus TaxID=1073414 RepID=UPI00056D4A3D|nr:DNA-processing protein DprA [Porticoccus hydrocarbonoclasticus]